MAAETDAKVVSAVVDGGGLYLSRAAAAGGWVFLSAPPVGPSGALAEAAHVEAPYQLSWGAHARAQGRCILEGYRNSLAELGGSLADVVQTEDYVPTKRYLDGYLEVSRDPELLGESNRPDSTMAQVDALVPDAAVVASMAIAALPDVHGSKEVLRSEAPFFAPDAGAGAHWPGPPQPSEVVAAGPYVFTTVAGHDYRQGPHREAKTVEWYWHGHEMRSEAEYTFGLLQTKLAAAGSTLADVVHVTVLLPDTADLYELDRVWGELWPEDPPARTVIPVRSLGHPRRDDARGHRHRATRMELQVRALRPGSGAKREVIGTGAQALGVQSEAVRGGSLLWTSGLLAGGPQGAVTEPDATSQVQLAFDWIAELVEAAGTRMEELLRVRAFLNDARDVPVFFAALRERVPADPPCVGVAVVPGALPVPGCSVLLDAVAHVA